MDIVITWVDGKSPEHRQARAHRARAAGEMGDDFDGGQEHLYRDLGQLRYLLRSVELYAPWRGRVFLVTDGQLPSWLNTEAADLVCVTHREIFSSAHDLPTFNSRAIEANLHRIEGISDRFVYCNDDFFLMSETSVQDFVTADGKVVLHMNPYRRAGRCRASCLPSYIEPLCRTEELLEGQVGAGEWLMMEHVPYLIDRGVMEEVQAIFAEALAKESARPFRHVDGIDPLHLYSNYLLSKGHPVVEVPAFYYGLSDNRMTNAAVYDVLLHYPPKFVCLNDEMECFEENILADLRAFYEAAFPKKSCFEKEGG